MICPNCGEDNSANFRYCGMCGTSLEPRRPAGAPRTVSAEAQRTLQHEAERNDSARARVTRSTSSAIHEAPPTAGPSFLGLNQPYTESPTETSHGSPTESFSSLDSFFEPEEPGVSVRGIILLLLLLGALGAGGWWAYSHYNGPRSTAITLKPTPTQPETSSNPPNPTAPQPSSTPVADSTSQATPSPSAAPPVSSAPAATDAAKSSPPPLEEPKVERSAPPPKPVERAHRNEKVARAVATKPAQRPAPATPVSANKGEAEFKRGEAYLYGRGVAENCNEAIRNLKESSAKQNAKARSTFGTMYATGHCVPRDLPTSYSWFAQALRADPNNQILEKDLTAVWNQMTPPERQIAARSKP